METKRASELLREEFSHAKDYSEILLFVLLHRTALHHGDPVVESIEEVLALPPAPPPSYFLFRVPVRYRSPLYEPYELDQESLRRTPYGLLIDLLSGRELDDLGKLRCPAFPRDDKVISSWNMVPGIMEPLRDILLASGYPARVRHFSIEGWKVFDLPISPAVSLGEPGERTLVVDVKAMACVLPIRVRLLFRFEDCLLVPYGGAVLRSTEGGRK